jgi:hypothetical protein
MDANSSSSSSHSGAIDSCVSAVQAYDHASSVFGDTVGSFFSGNGASFGDVWSSGMNASHASDVADMWCGTSSY